MSGSRCWSSSAVLLIVALSAATPRTHPAGVDGTGQTGALDPTTVTTRTALTRHVPRGLDLYMPVPLDNAMTGEAIALGRRLFFEPRLSRDASMSCASCHDPDRAFAGSGRVSVGIGRQRGHRNVPTLVNRGYGRSFFWDGRAATLEAQVLQPIANPVELGASVDEVLGRLASDASYRSAFRAAFGREPTEHDLARALASYVRTISSGDSPFDRAMGREPKEMSDRARRGSAIFLGRGDCWLCHTGPTLTDEQFHNTGIAWRTGSPSDIGRAAVTGRGEDRGAFKTPTLREVARTAPYMHDGSVRTLEEVVDHYDRGGHANPYLDARLRPLKLTDGDRRDLVAFLKSLNGRVSEGR